MVAIAVALGLMKDPRATSAQSPLQDPAQRPTFRIAIDAVRVEVSVRNRDKSVTGLQAPDFELLDNDVRQEIADLTYGKMPIDITIALDVSYSVTGAMLGRLRRAVVELMRDLGPEDRLKLVLFNNRITRTVDFTRDVRAVERAMSAAVAGGGTVVFDTIGVALVSALNPEHRQLVVCFTDGEDTNSTTGAEELIGVARRTRATLALVMPPSAPRPRGASMSRRDELYGTLVAETGGSRINIVPSSNLTDTFRRILEDFRSAYVIHFRPQGVDRTGFHTLRVSVRREGANVLARRGYFGG